MGCISSADVNNPKKGKGKKENVKQIEPALYKSKMDKSYNSKIITPRAAELPSMQTVQNPSAPRIKKTTAVELLTQYEITSTLIESTRLEGPKLITNKITGAVNVLRVYSADRVDEERLKKYHQLLKFQLYTDEQENYLIVDQQSSCNCRYCSGQSVCELFDCLSEEEEQRLTAEEKRAKQLQIYQALVQVYDVIALFHSNKLYLGGLNLFSFKKLSDFGNDVRLVDFCFQEHVNTSSSGSSDTYRMGHAHSNSFQADWQFYGYLLQFYLSSKSPVFISHKMQYIQNDATNPYMPLISTLLKGRQITRQQVDKIDPDRLRIRNPNILMGYKFCNDVIRLVKARKRRNKHSAVYYSKEIFDFYYSRNKRQQDTQPGAELYEMGNLYNPQNNLLLTQQNLHRLQTDRILNHVQTYIERLNSQCEEHFNNYSATADSFRKLKEVFLIADKKLQFDQFKDLIPQIK